MILSFVFICKDEWLFAGAYTSDKCQEVGGIFVNSTRTASYFAEYIGRLVVHFEKDFRASYLLAENYVGKMEVVGIYREKYVCEPFPGYADLCIPLQP